MSQRVGVNIEHKTVGLSLFIKPWTRPPRTASFLTGTGTESVKLCDNLTNWRLEKLQTPIIEY